LAWAVRKISGAVERSRSALNVERLRGPLLETSTSILLAMEMREAILAQAAKRNSTTPTMSMCFQQPVNRFNSMTRHFDWFNFWLLGGRRCAFQESTIRALEQHEKRLGARKNADPRNVRSAVEKVLRQNGIL